ncbi:hypothetical protein VTI28DRAFT_3509 [Corynascus sepedonium]
MRLSLDALPRRAPSTRRCRHTSFRATSNPVRRDVASAARLPRAWLLVGDEFPPVQLSDLSGRARSLPRRVNCQERAVHQRQSDFQFIPSRSVSAQSPSSTCLPIADRSCFLSTKGAIFSHLHGMHRQELLLAHHHWACHKVVPFAGFAGVAICREF